MFYNRLSLGNPLSPWASEETVFFATLAQTWLSSLFNFSIDFSFVPNLVLSLILGVVLGYERRKRNKVAGLRTHMIICVSTCLITLSGVYAAQGHNSVDPTRIAAQILSGVGFVGAGVIMRQGFVTSGVTTAASILMVTGVGIACGFGQFALAIIGTFLDVIALIVTTRYFPQTKENGDTNDSGSPIKLSLKPEKFEEIRAILGDGYKLMSIMKKDDLLKITINTNLSQEQREALLDRLVNAQALISMEATEPQEQET